MLSSRMLDGYCADIEGLVREGLIRPALRLALALPDICTALEDSNRQSSGERYAAWCTAWLQWQPPTSPKLVDGNRLFRLYARRPFAGGGRAAASQTDLALGALRRRRGARTSRGLGRDRVWQSTTGRVQTLELGLCEGLVKSTRRWYRDVGQGSSAVQRNLGILAVMR